MQEALWIKNEIENLLHTLPVQNDSFISEIYKKYPIILQGIAQVIDVLGKQGLALRGIERTSY